MYIKNDNFKIISTLYKLFLIKVKEEKRIKLKYFYKYKTIIQLSKNKAEIHKKKIPYKIGQFKVYDRLFNDYVKKQNLIEDLIKEYQIKEAKNYSFCPKTNNSRHTKHFNHYNNTNKNKNCLSDIENLRPRYKTKSIEHKIKFDNSKKKKGRSNYCNLYNKKNMNLMKNSNNLSSSISCMQMNFTDLTNRLEDFTSKNGSNFPINNLISVSRRTLIPSSSKYNHNYRMFIDESTSKKYKNIKLNKRSINKKAPNNFNKKYKSNFQDYLKCKIKKSSNNNQNYPYEIRLQKEIYKIFDQTERNTNILDKKNNSKSKNKSKMSINEIKNSSRSQNCIFSIDSFIGDNNLISTKDKFFSFGRQTLSNNSRTTKNNNSQKENSLIDKIEQYKKAKLTHNKIINRNIVDSKYKIYKLKKLNLQNLINHSSTNYTGSNSLYNLNNNRSKRLKESSKSSKQEQNISYDSQILIKSNDKQNSPTTLQTLTDSKILDLAEHRLPIDFSYESHKKANLINIKRGMKPKEEEQLKF